MKNMRHKKLFYTVSDFAKMFKITPMHAYRLISEGKVKTYKGNGMIRIMEEDLLDFYNTRGTRPLKRLKKIMQDMETFKKRDLF